MTALLKVFDVLPGWCWALMCGILLAMSAVQAARVSAAHADVAKAQLAVARSATDLANYKLATSETTRLLQKSNDADAIRRLTTVNEAINAASLRETALRESAAGARTDLERLRSTVAARDAARSRILSGTAPNAKDQPPAPEGGLFLECAAAFVRMAETAGGHASDVQTLTEGWPR